MKTVNIVKTEKGWHVTRMYCGRTYAAESFVIPQVEGKRKAEAARKATEAAKDAYVKAWVG